ncbi:MAG: hypothetical protein ACON4Z_06560 [Planctomycetota bacterium]
MTFRSTAALLTALSCLPAQAEPAPIAPLAPQVVLETVGPDGWRARLGPTNLGGLLASEEGRSLWRPLVQPMLDAWAGMLGSQDAYREASERILGYGGVARFAWRRSSTGQVSFAVVLDTDGRTDPAALAAELRRLIEVLVPGEWTARAVAGRDVELRSDAGMSLSAPRVDGAQLSILGGDPAAVGEAMGLRAWLTARPATLATPKPGSPAAQLRFDLRGLFATNGRGPDQTMLALFGLDSLRDLTLHVSAAGPHVQIGADVTTDGAPRGLAKAMMPTSAGVSGLAALLPEETSAAKVARLDPHALVEGLFAAAEAEMEGAREDAADYFGLDLADDLFAHATDELLVLGSPLVDFDRASEATWALAWRLRDDTKFRAALQKILKQTRGFLSGSETVDVDGVELRRYGNLIGYDLWIGVGNGLWVIAAGRDAEEQATALLRQAKGTELASTPAPPRGFDDLRRYLPAGCNGFARADLADIAGVPVDWWLMLLPELLPPGLGAGVDDEQAEEQAEAMRAMLIEHHLGVLRTATGSADGTWRWRLFW